MSHLKAGPGSTCNQRKPEPFATNLPRKQGTEVAVRSVRVPSSLLARRQTIMLLAMSSDTLARGGD
jgi:hypothetical protein